MATPEMDRLKERLRDARNFHVDWAEGASTLSSEERAAIINSVLDEGDAYDALPREEKLFRELARLAEAVREVEGLLRYSVRDIPPDAALRSKCIGILDMGLLLCNELRRGVLPAPHPRRPSPAPSEKQ